MLDLDETLIHCNTTNPKSTDLRLPIQFPSGEQVEAPVNIRPFVNQFLEEMSQLYEIIVFTASHGCYANVVLDHIDPTGVLIAHRLFREKCIQTDSKVKFFI